MIIDTENIKILKEVINKMADGEVFHDNMSRICHMWGLQGFKRLHRYNSLEDRNRRIKLQHYIIDRFGENLEPDWDYAVKTPNDIQEMLNYYIDWEESVIETIGEKGNKLILNKWVNEGKKIQNCLDDVSNEIMKARRYRQEFSKAEYDWEYIRYVDNKLHEKYKAKENEQGFKM